MAAQSVGVVTARSASSAILRTVTVAGNLAVGAAMR